MKMPPSFPPQGVRKVEKCFCRQSSVQTFTKGSKCFTFTLVHLLVLFQNTQIVLELLATEVYGKKKFHVGETKFAFY